MALAKEASELKVKCELIDIAEALLGRVYEVTEPQKVLTLSRGGARLTLRVPFAR